MLKDKLKMNLQYFADDPEDTESGAEDPKGDEIEEQIVFDSQEDLDKVIEGRLAKERKNLRDQFNSEIDEKVQKALEKEKDLSKLSKEDREKAELAEERKQIEAEKRRIKLQDQRYQAIDELQERKLPKEFVDYVVEEDAEKTLENIKTFEAAFNAAVDAKVEEQVSEALKGKAPKRPGNKGNMANPFAKETFNLTEQGRLLKENPELYKMLKAQANN